MQPINCAIALCLKNVHTISKKYYIAKKCYQLIFLKSKSFCSSVIKDQNHRLLQHI